jgi:hypothetical protein
LRIIHYQAEIVVSFASSNISGNTYLIVSAAVSRALLISQTPRGGIDHGKQKRWTERLIELHRRPGA